MQQQYNKHNQKTNATTINTIKKMHHQYSQQLKKKYKTTNTTINKRHNKKQVKQNATTMHSNKKN